MEKHLADTAVEKANSSSVLGSVVYFDLLSLLAPNLTTNNQKVHILPVDKTVKMSTTSCYGNFM